MKWCWSDQHFSQRKLSTEAFFFRIMCLQFYFISLTELVWYVIKIYILKINRFWFLQIMMHEEWTMVNNINNVMVNDNRQHATSIYVTLPYMLNQCFIAHGVSSHHLITNWSNYFFVIIGCTWQIKSLGRRSFRSRTQRHEGNHTPRHKKDNTRNRRRYTLVFRFIHSWEGEEGSFSPTWFYSSRTRLQILQWTLCTTETNVSIHPHHKPSAYKNHCRFLSFLFLVNKHHSKKKSLKLLKAKRGRVMKNLSFI